MNSNKGQEDKAPKYKVLFTEHSNSPEDNAVSEGTLLGYADDNWTYDSFKEAFYEAAVRNDYTLNQFIIVKVIEYDIAEAKS